MTLDFLASSNLPTVTIINCLSLQHPHDPTLDLAVEKIDKLTSNVAEKMKQLDERSESLQTELTKVKQVLKRTKDDRNAYRLKYENERCVMSL